MLILPRPVGEVRKLGSTKRFDSEVLRIFATDQMSGRPYLSVDAVE